jgi:hypothetical protein
MKGHNEASSSSLTLFFSELVAQDGVPDEHFSVRVFHGIGQAACK